jgi:HlyD family secretion protein
LSNKVSDPKELSMQFQSPLQKFFLKSAAFLMIAATLAGCAGASAKAQAPAAPAGKVQEITFVDTVEASGTVAASQTASLMWNITGTVDKVNVKPGDIVKTGDVLMTLNMLSAPATVLSAQVDLVNAQKSLSDLYDTAEISKVQALNSITTDSQAVRDAQYQLENYTVPTEQANMDPMQAMDLMKQRLDQAWKNFEPYMYLSESNATRKNLLDALNQAQSDYDSAVKRLRYIYQLDVAQANLDQARKDYEKWSKGPDPADVAAANARIQAAQASLSQVQITAPFSGQVLVVNYSPGDVVVSSQPAVVLSDLQHLRVEVSVDETDYSRVHLNSSAQITLDALPGVKLTGKVSYINLVGAADSGIVKYTVRVDLDTTEAQIPLGATADVIIQNGEPQKSLAVPLSSVSSDTKGEYVMVIGTDGALKRVDVTTGALQGDLVIVSGDLQAGQELASAQTQSLPGPGGRFFGGG